MVLGGFVFTVVVLWSWNNFAPDIFQLPEMKFKQALGLVLFTSCIAFILRIGGRHSNSHKHWIEHEGFSK